MPNITLYVGSFDEQIWKDAKAEARKQKLSLSCVVATLLMRWARGDYDDTPIVTSREVPISRRRPQLHNWQTPTRTHTRTKKVGR